MCLDTVKVRWRRCKVPEALNAKPPDSTLIMMRKLFWFKQKFIQDEINIKKNHYVLINKL